MDHDVVDEAGDETRDDARDDSKDEKRDEASREFSHLDDEGRARMVDVSGKPASDRLARATARVAMAPETLGLLREKALPKGDVLAVARVAGIMAAKETPRLIPLCHPLNIGRIDIDFTVDDDGSAIVIETAVNLRGQTGAEMEALTAASVAALTIYDMCKAVDKNMKIGGIKVLEKRGGKSGNESESGKESMMVRESESDMEPV